MIIEVKAEYVREALTPIIEELVTRERARGDALVLENIIKSLEEGRLTCLLIQGPQGLEPLAALFCKEYKHPYTNEETLYIEHIMVGSSERMLTELDTVDLRIFNDLLKTYDKCLFTTDNPALVGFLEKFGLTIKPVKTVYQIGGAQWDQLS